MLANYIEKVKNWNKRNQTDLFIAAIIFLIGIVGFGLGRLSVVWPEKEPIWIENPAKTEEYVNKEALGKNAEKSAGVVNAAQEKYVASKSGTAYHFPWCPGAQKIKEANKIWFNSKEEAKKMGYKPAGNCPGL